MKNFETSVQSLDSLKAQLEAAGIPVSEWGAGSAKTLTHLQEEIASGESILIAGDSDEILRKVMVVGANVYYSSPNGIGYRLKEQKQVFKDGRERQRELGHAVAEKMKSSETPELAIVRGVREELGIDGEITPYKTSSEVRVAMSESYPGLMTQYIRHRFDVMLDESQFNPSGYVEEQSDKSTYFVWEEMQ